MSDRKTLEFVQAARALRPVISAAADQIEHDRRLPEPLVRALSEAGLFRMLVPEALGGGESDLGTFASAIEQIATVDGSTAWCLSQAAASGRSAASLDCGAADAVFGNPGDVMAWGTGEGSAISTDGGFRLTGHWSFASGIHHATWLGGQSVVHRPDGTVHRGADGSPQTRVLLFPVGVAEITDVWQVSGLRGTGSDNYAVRDLFVPEAHSFVWDTSALECATSPLYVIPQGLVYAVGFCSVAQGIARGAMDAFVELARTKTRSGRKSTLRDNPVVQAEVARAEAALCGARAFLHTAITDAWDAALSTKAVPVKERMMLRLAATSGIHAAAAVVDVIYGAAGSGAIFSSNPFERRFRDVHAVTQQIQASPIHFETVGQFLLGAG